MTLSNAALPPVGVRWKVGWIVVVGCPATIRTEIVT